MYDVYLDKVLLPVAPSQIKLKIRNQNKTVTLINEGEVNLLKRAGLSEIAFTALLPQTAYPFAKYKSGFQGAEFFLNALEKFKTDRDEKGNWVPFQFIVSRMTPDMRLLFDSNIKVSLEDYTINEDAKNGFDVYVDVKLKQFNPYGAKTVQIIEPTSTPKSQPAPPRAVIQAERTAETAPQARTHTVVKGDTLWGIAKRYYNNGNEYPKIHEANRDKVSNPNLIYPGQVLNIP